MTLVCVYLLTLFIARRRSLCQWECRDYSLWITVDNLLVESLKFCIGACYVSIRCADEIGKISLWGLISSARLGIIRSSLGHQTE